MINTYTHGRRQYEALYRKTHREQIRENKRRCRERKKLSAAIRELSEASTSTDRSDLERYILRLRPFCDKCAAPTPSVKIIWLIGPLAQQWPIAVCREHS